MLNLKLQVPIEEIRNNLNLNDNYWKTMINCNCYAFALGIDMDERLLNDNAFIPGFLAEKELNYYSSEYYREYNELLEHIDYDLDALGLEHKQVDPNYELSPEEWKIAIFTQRQWNKVYDFHFLRQTKNGIWLHKKGWNGDITNKDYKDRIITTPNSCDMAKRKYEKTLCLKLK